VKSQHSNTSVRTDRMSTNVKIVGGSWFESFQYGMVLSVRNCVETREIAATSPFEVRLWMVLVVFVGVLLMTCYRMIKKGVRIKT